MTKIALIPVALMVDGQRKVIPAGAELPALLEHDERALLAAKAISDDAADAQAAQARADAAKAANAEFQAARKAARQAQESTAAAPAGKKN